LIRRFDASQGPRIVGPGDGRVVHLGGVGARFMVWAEEAGGGFSLVEHPIAPRTLAAPLHRHSKEDEYSYVLAGDTPCRILEIISPGGFEHFFADLADGVGTMDELAKRYGNEVDMEGTMRVCQEHGLEFPMPPPGPGA
jgi:hypothetical protein